MEQAKNRRRMRGRSILLMALLLTLLPGAGPVHAANLTVTTTVDELNSDGDCSLREAIQAATTDTAVDACVAGSGADIITVPAGTYNLTIGDLDLQDVTINGTGAGSTIIKQTNPNFRVIEVLGTVNISRVTIQDGRAADSNIVPTHLHGSGLHNHGTVTLTNVTFTGNSVANLIPTNPTSGKGGAIWNAGSMTLINVTIANNTAAVSGAGIGGNAPTIINTILANNSPDNCSVAIPAGSDNLQFPAFLQASGLPSCGGTIPVADPMLGPLTGGVHPLLAGSPAIDKGTNTGCPPTDELGTARPQGAACDIGAYEFQDATAPTVVSIMRADPNPTSAASVDFTVTFSENVTGVNESDFSMTQTVIGADVTGVTPISGTTYTVTVSTGTGNGTIRLDVPAGSATINDESGNPLANLPFESGETYTIIKTNWFIRGVGSFALGTGTDIPASADYNGDGKDDLAVFRPSNSTWYINGIGSFPYGTTNDIPVVADYNGDAIDDIAVFRPSNSTWYVRGVGSFVYGVSGDIPVPADYNGDGKDDIAVFRESNSTWYILGVGPSVYGTTNDIPVVGDYNGDGKADIAVFRESNSTWYIRGIGSFVYGQTNDIPVVGDYNGDGKADIAVFRESNSTWYILGVGPSVYGQIGDIPVVADYNGDGKADIAVFRP